MEGKILAKGLSYVPTNTPQELQWDIDLYKFGRQLRITDFFKNEQSKVISRFRPKSSFDPISNQATIKTFLKIVQKETSDLLKHHKTQHQNTSREEWRAIRSLANDASITIRSADKGGSIVVMDYACYARAIYLLLEDATTYVKLQGNPTISIQNKFGDSFSRGLQLNYINQELFEFLTKKHPKIPKLYGIPKIHKNLTHPPMRPIVSAIGGVIEPVAQWLDYLFKAPVYDIPTCVKDTPMFLQRITSIDTDLTDTVLITMDVKSLYTIIPHEAGVDAMRELLSCSDKYDGPCIEYILELLLMALKNNYFRFENNWYLQKMGMSMGAAM
uniref:Reverse transcriptase domain-containing protein n=1 Tax=Leptobrachium leishanense TaxID=445787 RepID=A0A8C5MBV0_9ANUR